jgi:lysophospholipase L1-like esterase
MPALARYLGVLQALDVPPPLVVMLTLEGTREARLFTHQDQYYYPFGAPPPIHESTLALPEVLIDSYGTEADYYSALRPALDALWNAGDAPACPFYDASGHWTGPK